MPKAFRYFMKHLIDYAGLFPPADLDFDTALANFADYLQGEHCWMLGNFILPCIRLPAMQDTPHLPCSILVSPEIRPEESELLRRYHHNIKAIEVSFPPTRHPPSDYTERINHIESQLGHAGLRNIRLFVESPHPEAMTQALAGHRDHPAHHEQIASLGYKLRCGGLDRSAYPHSPEVAKVIALCKQFDLPIKFTAGLHHPLRNFSELHCTTQHGFLNIFGAALLYWANRLSEEDMTDLLNEQDPVNLQFSTEGFAWRSHFIDAETINRLRGEKVISFGSCSFLEPLHGIRQLRLLEDAPAPPDTPKDVEENSEL